MCNVDKIGGFEVVIVTHITSVAMLLSWELQQLLYSVNIALNQSLN